MFTIVRCSRLSNFFFSNIAWHPRGAMICSPTATTKSNKRPRYTYAGSAARVCGVDTSLMISRAEEKNR